MFEIIWIIVGLFTSNWYIFLILILLSYINILNPIKFTNKNTGKTDIGLIAHELQEFYPELVTGEFDGEQLQSINYQGLIGILIQEIKSLKQEVKELKEKVNM